MASTGIDISSMETFRRIDSFDALKAALDNGGYSFQRDQKKHSEIREVLQPMFRFLGRALDDAAGAASSVC